VTLFEQSTMAITGAGNSRRMETWTGGGEALDTGTDRPWAEPGRRAPRTVYWTTAAAASLQAFAENRFPGEACGVLGGTSTGATAAIIAFIPLPNRDPRPDRFAVEAVDFATAEAALRGRGLVWLGFAHSHPTGDALPSPADLALLWRCCLQVIVPVRAGVAGEALGHWFDREGAWNRIPMRVLP
jgi:proteasome lid subunit RPN8/RPN11